MPSGRGGAWLVCTGGEPALQLDAELVAAFKQAGFAVAIETNGTVSLPSGLDWICVSPKAGAPPSVRRGDELKVVFPQPDLDLDALLQWEFDHFYVQPMDGPRLGANTRLSTSYCLEHPPWCLSEQSHKRLGLR